MPEHNAEKRQERIAKAKAEREAKEARNRERIRKAAAKRQAKSRAKKAADKKRENLARQISPSSSDQDVTLKKVMGINVRKFINLIKKRAGTDDLHKMTDVLQAETAISLLTMIEDVQVNIRNQGGLNKFDASEKIRMINTIKTAIASVDATLKALGLTKSVREGEMREDGSLDRLLSDEIKYNIPPTLQDEYVRFQKDIEGAVEKSKEDSSIVAEKEAALSLIKKPIESYEENSVVEEEDETMVEADKSPVKQLG